MRPGEQRQANHEDEADDEHILQRELGLLRGEGRGSAPSAAEHPREPRGARHCVQHELPDLRGVAQDPNVPLCSISGYPACERRQEPA